MLWLLALCDGEHSLLDIAIRPASAFETVAATADDARRPRAPGRGRLALGTTRPDRRRRPRAQLDGRHVELPSGEEASAKPLGARHSIPRIRISPLKQVGVEPVLAATGYGSSTTEAPASPEPDPTTGEHRDSAAHVSVPFRDLVLEDQVIPERVPGQLADQAVVLMEVVTGVREDELGVDPRLELLEDILDLGGRVRQISVPERMDLDGSILDIRQDAAYALARASSPRSPDAARTTQ